VSQRAFLLAAATIVLLAFGLREWFVLTMTVPEPNQGDVSDYLRYALHLAWDGTFSKSADVPAPDAFRSPGYPWLLWSVLPPGDWGDGRWFERVYQVQALLGAATVGCLIALAHAWMPRGYALAAGLLMALQAHNIAATGALLSEVLFGALLVAGLLAFVSALEARSWRLGALAGAALGLGYLTNPVLGLLPLLLAPLGWRQARGAVLAALAVFALLAGAWSARNVLVHADGAARAEINFVQGAWPEYHDIAKRPWQYPAKRVRMEREIAVISSDRAAGVRMVFERFAAEPARYAGWYLRKPWLLFDWEVRIGHGMAYVVTMRDTVLDRGLLLGTTTVQWVLNPLLFWLAFAGIALGLWRGGPARVVAVTVIYLTAVHVVLQAEPRYAIPYRALEIALAFGAIAWLDEWVRRRVGGGRFVSAAEAGVGR
jgi:4-amino-4-deoxy-L-arabinose transferase-like glycosyltransferase